MKRGGVGAAPYGEFLILNKNPCFFGKIIKNVGTGVPDGPRKIEILLKNRDFCEKFNETGRRWRRPIRRKLNFH